jgi:hypothetical protein
LFFIGEGREEKDVRKFCKWFGKDRAALKHGAYTQSPLSRANTCDGICPKGASFNSAGIHPRVNGRDASDPRKVFRIAEHRRAALKHGAYTQSPLSRANTYERFCPAGALCESAGIHPRVNVDEKLWC